MRRVDGSGRPAIRLLTAVLSILLGIIGVHGAGSATVPSGAIATEHASIGAALLHLAPAVGRIDQALVSAGHVDDPDAVSGLLPALPAPTVVVPTQDGPAEPVTATISAATSRVDHGRLGRAPPA